jgi:hypothetical protein
MTSLVSAILAAITYLAPGLDPVVRTHYAKIIVAESDRQHVDPFYVVAHIHTETAKSWSMSVRSKTWDHGLMQVHVSNNSNPHLRGFEEVLYHPATNVRYGISTLVMWTRWHDKNCHGAHDYWNHMKWGYKVKDTKWGDKVGRLYRMLTSRFGKKIVLPDA